jgi:hypothetical protein
MIKMEKTSSPEIEESRETSPVTSVPTSTETQELITEQQVLFSTAAAAVALPPAKTHRWSDTVQAVTRALHAMFATSEKPPAQRHYPKRYGYLENALMSREMDRL